MRYLTLPKSSINSHTSLVYDSPAQNRYPVSLVPPAVDEATRHPIHVKMEYLGNGSPQSSFMSSGNRNGSVIRQPNNTHYDSPNYTTRLDNQTHDMSIELPTGMSLANQTDSIEAASNTTTPRETGALRSGTDGPAIIVPEVSTNRTSGTAHVLPGDFPDDYIALFIK